MRKEEEEKMKEDRIEKQVEKKKGIIERRWRNLKDNLDDGKEDKHWEEMEEKGEQEKENEGD